MTAVNSAVFEYDKPVVKESATEPFNLCSTALAWARVPLAVTIAEERKLKERVKVLLKQQDAVLVSHYYVDAALQDLARETGGCVGDSLEMARFGSEHPASKLIVAGVRFMGETAKILSPEKCILMPDLGANCSLDLGCPIADFSAFCDAHPDRTVVVYANTSAEVKARADWVVTSSIALEIVGALQFQGERIVWGPDRHLGEYVRRETGADMLLWQGSCLVHNEFKGTELQILKAKYPDAVVLVHPESPAQVVALADVVGSTSKLIKAASESSAKEFIVATDQGILHEMRLVAPEKTFLAAPTAGEGAGCKSCAFCPWMAMNDLRGVVTCLEQGIGEIDVEPTLGLRARRSIDRMLNFAKNYQKNVRSSGDFEQDEEMYAVVGAV